MATLPNPSAVRETAGTVEELGFDSVWAGDHVAWPLPALDPFLQLAQLAPLAEHVLLGTGVYLLPLRHPTHVAKQVATLDRLCGGRFVFGVGIGGEFPIEYAACGVPVHERGARMSEAIPLLRKLWSGNPIESQGRFYPFPEVRLLPTPAQSGGPPIWCGGRSRPALRRAGRIGDGWVSYVVTPERYQQSLEEIAKAGAEVDRRWTRFGTGHLFFFRIDADRERAFEAAAEHLSQRYGMDFREPTRRYAAYGRPADIAERVAAFQESGLRHLILDPVGPGNDRGEQLARFAREVRPLL
jgi:probable F420-dependent oxidoreductase